jgi:DNA ligase-1
VKKFAQLLELLALTPSRNRKIEALTQYFATTPDPDRGYALAILTGALSFKNVKPAVLRDVVTREVDPVLFGMSYDYVGDLGETIALIWPHHGAQDDLPSLTDLIELFNTTSKSELPALIASLLTRAAINERWALVKLATGALRIGLSARLAKTALANMSGKDLQQLEEIWHGITLPYTELFDWLEDKGERPDIDHASRFHPMMLSNPIDEEKDLAVLAPADFAAEWKWDGIRVQLILGKGKVSLFSRTGDDIAGAFPDLVDNVFGEAVLDGELLVGRDFEPDAVQRPAAAPQPQGGDAALQEASRLRARLRHPVRRQTGHPRPSPGASAARISKLVRAQPAAPPSICRRGLTFADWPSLADLRRKGAAEHGHEGVMLKLRTRPMSPGGRRGCGSSGSAIPMSSTPS